MQMHDYARKPRGRKVFSSRREGEAESREAGKRGREGGEGGEEKKEEEEDEKVESKGNEIMYATGARAFFLPLFLLFAPFLPSPTLHSSTFRILTHTGDYLRLVSLYFQRK